MFRKPLGRVLLLPLLAVHLASFVPALGQIVRGPYVQMVTQTSAVIRWRTEIPTDSRVRYGAVPGNLPRWTDNGAMKTEHEVHLNDLSPGSKHFYAVGTRALQKASGDENHYFWTAPAPTRSKATRIWAIGDFGTGDANQAAVRDAFLSFTGKRDPDVWITMGDNAYAFGTDADFQKGLFTPYAQLVRRVPMWPSLGNHDTALLKELRENYPYFSIFNLPKAGEAGGVPSGTERYYSFDHGDIHFICLDTQLEPLMASSRMAQWLKQDLEVTDKKWIIAYCHHPPYSRGSHPSDTELEMKQFREVFVPILEGGGIDLVLAGHSHNYERSYLLAGHHGVSNTLAPGMILNHGSGRAEETGAYTKPALRTAGSGTVYVVVGNSGAGWGGGTLDHPAMFISYGANVYGSMVIDVEGDRLEAKYLRHNASIGDHFTILKANLPPAAEPLQIQVPFDQSRDIALKATDANGGTLTYSISRAPARGRILHLNPLTGSLIYVPKRGFHGSDSFDFTVTDEAGASASAAVSLNVIPPVDLNRNGLPDDWEATTAQSQPDVDPDGDGFSNFEEWLAGTDPNDGSSFLSIENATGSEGILLRWQAVGGVRYRLSYSENGGPFTEIVRPVEEEMAPVPSKQATRMEFADDRDPELAPSARTNRSYKLSVFPPLQNAAPAVAAGGTLQTVGSIARSALLQASVDDPDRDPVRVVFKGRASVRPPGPDFTIIALPDTQYYTDGTSGGSPTSFQAQADWIVRNRMARNIVFVTQLGDCTNNGDHSRLHEGKPVEWEIASRAMYAFENPSKTALFEGIPYGIAVGNHDQIPSEDPDGTTIFYNRYFGVRHFSPKTYYGGSYGIDNDNHYQFFSASGLDFIVIHLEYDNKADSAVLAWADSLLKMHSKRRAIICSHRLLGADGVLQPQGVATYEALKDNPNLFMMLCAHHAGESRIFRTHQGRTISIMMMNYQHRGNGGDGWLRILRFSPATNRIYAETYSPTLGKYEIDSNSQFSDPYDMSLPPLEFAELGTQPVNAVPGSASLEWVDLVPGTDYEWYATADDGGGPRSSTIQKFRTPAATAPEALPAVVQVSHGEAPRVALQSVSNDGEPTAYGIEIEPAHGSIRDFDYRAGTFIYVPAHGFSGTDTLTFRVSNRHLVSTPAVVTLQVLPSPDSNGNGLPDRWELFFGLSDPHADPDGDGRTNLQEYLAGTHPLNRASLFEISSLSLQPFLQNPNRLRHVIEWKGVAGMQYRVQYSDSATGMQFIDIVRPPLEEIATGPEGTETVQRYVDDYSKTGRPPASGRRFFRVRVVR